MGNSDEIQTPKGIFAAGDTALHLSYYIGNYKGGRNESCMYGVDTERVWYDVDLKSAYTTAMAHMGLPSYKRARLVSTKFVEEMSTKDLLNGYLILNAKFEFPVEIKYPSIPCYVDSTTTVYPLFGKSLLTGPEYLLAKNQGCKIVIKSAFYIPQSEEVIKTVGGVKIKRVIKPFHSIIKDIQEKRREYPKGHILNLLYKEMGNSIYGNLVRGMSNKRSFDPKSGRTIRMTATELSNPILAS